MTVASTFNDDRDYEFAHFSHEEASENVCQEDLKGVAKSQVHHCFSCSVSFEGEDQIQDHFKTVHGAISCQTIIERLAEVPTENAFEDIDPEQDRIKTEDDAPLDCLKKIEDIKPEHDRIKTENDAPVDCLKYVEAILNEKDLIQGEKQEKKKLKKPKIKEEIPSVFICAVCGKEYGTKARLSVHVSNTHDDERLSCEICGNILKGKANLRAHMKNIHITSALENHQNWLQCQLCERTCKNANNLYNHIKQVHETVEGLLCNLCGKTAKNNYKLKAHIRRCKLVEPKFRKKKEENFSCDKCQSKFEKMEDLKGHVAYVHVHNPTQCQLCYRRCANFIRIKQHLRRSHSLQVAPDLFIFLNKDGHAVQKQLEKASSSRPVVATIPFDKNIGLDAQLESLVTYRASGKWECIMCGKTTKLRHHVLYHAETHIEGNTHTCGLCNKSYSTRHSLSKHINYIHSVEVYSCEDCGKSNMNKGSLHKHKSRCNGALVPEIGHLQ